MSFSGTVSSDFMKLATVDEAKKTGLIDYKSLDFDTLKASLIKYIKAVYPLDYQNFNESDLGMMLLELIAYQGHVNSFKADALANENYLRTSKKRNNIKKLLELVGVRLKGPISAAANARITWDNAVSPSVSIPFANRAVTITSPEDGAPLTFILYKVVNGRVDLANDTGNIVLNSSESADNDNKIFTNLVLLEGGLVKEEGSFDGTELIKTVPLTQAPVVEGSVEVFITGDGDTNGVYTQVENVFFASGASDKVFQMVSNDDFQATVVFGDDKLGRSPRTNDTYTILYRVGGGTRGNIANEVVNVALTVEGNTGVIENISIGTGGQDAETVEHAKRYAPLTFRRQDRLVTLSDFKVFGNTYLSTYGSTGKVTAATRRAFSSANIINIIVLEKANDTQLRKATPQFKLDLLAAMNAKKMLTDELVVIDGLIRTLDLVVNVRADKKYARQEETIKLKVRDKILDFFAVENNDYGKTLVLQDLNRAVFELSEVVYSTVDNLSSDIHVAHNEIIQLNNLNINITLV